MSRRNSRAAKAARRKQRAVMLEPDCPDCGSIVTPLLPAKDGSPMRAIRHEPDCPRVQEHERTGDGLWLTVTDDDGRQVLGADDQPPPSAAVIDVLVDRGIL